MAKSAKAAGEPRFIADCHLGKLAKYLRFMGYDTLYFRSIEDNELIALSKVQKRIILTHDAELSRRKNANAYYLIPIDTAGQLADLSKTYGIQLHDDKRRCLICNAQLLPIDVSDLGDRVPEKVKAGFNAFRECPECGRVYWDGDHYRNMKAFINTALSGEV